MAYSKMVKTTADHALGYQSVNQLAGNFDAQYAAWIVAHGQVEPHIAGGRGHTSYNPPAWAVLGHHNADPIPRDVVQATVSYNGQFIAPTLTVSGSNFIVNATRISTGLYFFEVTGLSTFWGEAIPQASSAATDPFAVPRSYYATVAGQPSGIYVATYVESGGTDTATDMSFTLTVYGTT